MVYICYFTVRDLGGGAAMDGLSYGRGWGVGVGGGGRSRPSWRPSTSQRTLHAAHHQVGPGSHGTTPPNPMPWRRWLSYWSQGHLSVTSILVPTFSDVARRMLQRTVTNSRSQQDSETNCIDRCQYENCYVSRKFNYYLRTNLLEKFVHKNLIMLGPWSLGLEKVLYWFRK